jgi:hypothetical protein
MSTAELSGNSLPKQNLGSLNHYTVAQQLKNISGSMYRGIL